MSFGTVVLAISCIALYVVGAVFMYRALVSAGSSIPVVAFIPVLPVGTAELAACMYKACGEGIKPTYVWTVFFIGMFSSFVGPFFRLVFFVAWICFTIIVWIEIFNVFRCIEDCGQEAGWIIAVRLFLQFIGHIIMCHLISIAIYNYENERD